ncbi:YARHG domain-containing protein [Camelimonas sp. ID_303_24]
MRMQGKPAATGRGPGLATVLALATLLAPALAAANGLAAHPAISAATRAPALRVQGGACTDLWTERNEIYKGAGYCFKTRRAITTFGNAGCQYDNEADVPLSHVQRMRINEIRAAELGLGCTP